MQLKWLEWAKQIQAISQAGLEYSRDVYDIDRFQQLRELSIEIMQQYTAVESEQIRELFAAETGYATPKVDVRGVVFRDERILMVKEKIDGHWSLPGGWADIGLSPKEIAVKEVREESGYIVEPIRLLGVLDKSFMRTRLLLGMCTKCSSCANSPAGKQVQIQRRRPRLDFSLRMSCRHYR